MTRELDEHGFPVINPPALRGAVMELCAKIREAKQRGDVVRLWTWAEAVAVRYGVGVRQLLAKLRERQAAGQRRAAARKLMGGE